jgi:hypothetical protein
LLPSSGLFHFDLKRQFWIHVAAVIAGAMRQLGISALRATDVVNRLERMMAAAFSFPGFADALNGLHVLPMGDQAQ